jgi:hypothetical protein
MALRLMMPQRTPLTLRLVIAQFVRLITNDHPEVVQLFDDQLAPEHVGTLYDLIQGLDISSEKEGDIMTPSLRLVLGGILLYCLGSR